jgi:YihY family inner membrane protein
MPAAVRRLDELQRRRRALGMPLGVVYKFFDDQGGYLAATLTYYSFIAIFPLMLIGSSVLGFVLHDNPSLEKDLVSSALAQFPVVGDQLGRPEGIQGSAAAVVIGSLTALYGVVGLGQAAQNSVNTVWAIPRNSRLNPVVSRVRSLLWMVLAGLGLLAVAVVSSLGGTSFLGSAWVARVAAVLLATVVLAVMMRLSTPQRETVREVLPGALMIALLWQLLQAFGGAYVEHVVKRASEMNGVFALVLGLVAFIYIAVVIAILGLELNVVLAKKLYPRALLTPFTDAVSLTDADVRVYTDYARAQRHKGFERIQVTFERDAPPDD